MKKKSFIPHTKVKNPEPMIKDEDWIIWAAWADRITFEEIKEKTGKNESEVIKIMRKNLKPSSFRLWRKRVHNKSIKHRKKFKLSRKKMVEKIKNSQLEVLKECGHMIIFEKAFEMREIVKNFVEKNHK